MAKSKGGEVAIRGNRRRVRRLPANGDSSWEELPSRAFLLGKASSLNIFQPRKPRTWKCRRILASFQSNEIFIATGTLILPLFCPNLALVRPATSTNRVREACERVTGSTLSREQEASKS